MIKPASQQTLSISSAQNPPVLIKEFFGCEMQSINLYHHTQQPRIVIQLCPSSTIVISVTLGYLTQSFQDL